MKLRRSVIALHRRAADARGCRGLRQKGSTSGTATTGASTSSCDASATSAATTAAEAGAGSTAEAADGG